MLQKQSDLIVSGGKIDFARQRGPNGRWNTPLTPNDHVAVPCETSLETALEEVVRCGSAKSDCFAHKGLGQ